MNAFCFLLVAGIRLLPFDDLGERLSSDHFSYTHQGPYGTDQAEDRSKDVQE
jgi:hypothetical protein